MSSWFGCMTHLVGGALLGGALYRSHFPHGLVSERKMSQGSFSQ